MMKRMLLFTMVGMLSFGANLNAINPYQSLRNHVVGFGEKLEQIDNVPLIGKLTSLLPVAMIAAGFRKCPGQTMIVLAGLLAYVLAQNESVRSALAECGIIGQATNQTNSTESDDTLFVFDGEDEDDAQEEVDTEDELLGENLLEEEYDEQENGKRSVRQPSLKFL